MNDLKFAIRQQQTGLVDQWIDGGHLHGFVHPTIQQSSNPMNDIRFAFRQLLKNPGFTAVALLTLALGTGQDLSRKDSVSNLGLVIPDSETCPSPIRTQCPSVLRW